MVNSINNKFEAIDLIWRILSKKRKRQIIFFQLINLLSAFSEFINLFIIKIYLNGLINKEYLLGLNLKISNFYKIPEESIILYLGLFTIFFIAITAFLRISALNIGLRLGALVTVDIGAKVYQEILNYSYSWHSSNNTSKTLSILSDDLRLLRDSIIQFFALITNFLLILFIGFSLLIIEPILILILFSVIFILFGTIYRSSRESLQNQGLENTKSFKLGMQLISESLGSIRDILINNNQRFFLKNYIDKFRIYFITFGNLQAKYQSPRFLVESILISLIIITSIFLTYSKSIQGIDLSIIGIIIVGSYKLLIPFQICAIATSTLKSNLTSWNIIKSYFRSYENGKLPKKQYIEKSYSKEKLIFIELIDVSFKHHNRNDWVLKNFNLVINKGQKVGFVGYSGSGKTTCGDLISGLLKPNNGSIFIEKKNINISQQNLRNWHKSLAVVPQNLYLIEDSITNNIAFGIPKNKINFSRVKEVSKIALLDDMIMKLPNGYGEIIGEKGNKLSGGQIQRLATARALYKKAKCIIFDEATSALDKETENKLLSSLRSLDNDLTIIFISHRLSTMQNCDFLVFFEKNGNKLIGKYEELLENPRFRKFINNEKIL